MKKILFILLLFTSFALTGCASTQQGLTIKKDKSVDFTYRVILDEKFVSQKANNEEKEQTLQYIEESYKKNGFSFKKVNEEGKEGFVVTKHFKSLKELQNKKENYFLYDLKVEEQKRFIFSIYKVDILIPKEGVAGDFSNTVEQSLLKEGEYSFFIQTPYEATNANADKKDGKSLTWDLSYDKDEKIEFSYNHYYFYNILFSSILFILLVITTIILIKKRGKLD